MHEVDTMVDPLPSDFAGLLEDARRGDRSAQDALFRRYYAQVERIAHAQLRRDLGRRRASLAARFSTGDVVQNVFRSLLPALGTFQGASEGEFVAYVVKVVQSRTLDVIRHHRAACRDYRRSLPGTDDEPVHALGAVAAGEDAAPERHDLVDSYVAALATLSEPARRLVRARLERGLAFETLAQRFGYPSRYAARRAYFAAQARLALRLRTDLRP